MISFLFKPLWVMGFDYVDSQVIVKTTKEKNVIGTKEKSSRNKTRKTKRD